jgi:hypothetical protein
MTLEKEALPLLLIHFNRPDKSALIVSKLKTLPRRNVVVFIDGPRNEGDFAAANSIRDIFNDVKDFHDLEIIHQAKNLGCGKNCFQAIKYFFAKFQCGIVIEDDVGVDFSALEKIENEYFNSEQNVFCSLSPYGDWSAPSHGVGAASVPCIWGWYYCGPVDGFNLVSGDSLLQKFKLLWSKFTIFEAMYFTLLISLCERRIIDTWDFQFFYFLWKSNTKIQTIYPAIAENFGFDSSGTHLTEIPNFLVSKQGEFSCEKYNEFVLKEVHKSSFVNIIKLLVKSCFLGRKYE